MFENVDDGGPGCGRCDTISDLRFESNLERAEMNMSMSKVSFRLSVV